MGLAPCVPSMQRHSTTFSSVVYSTEKFGLESSVGAGGKTFSWALMISSSIGGCVAGRG
jgi:hypothetical protein